MSESSGNRISIDKGGRKKKETGGKLVGFCFCDVHNSIQNIRVTVGEEKKNYQGYRKMGPIYVVHYCIVYLFILLPTPCK